MSAQLPPSNHKSHSEHRRREYQYTQNMEISYPQSLKWVAVFIDGKFYLTNPSAFQKLQSLDKQISDEKYRLAQLNKQQNYPAENSKKIAAHDIKKEVKQRKNSFESALSRECKTQINELKALKAKIQIQKQLAQQQMKFQHKTIEVRKRRELKQSTTFVIRNQREKSMQQTQRRSIKQSAKNFMMAPHQLANKKSQQKQIKVKQVKQSYQKVENNRQKSIINKQKTMRNDQIKSKITQYSKSRYNKDNQASKSKQKSFIITSRKVSSSHSKDANCFVSGPKQQRDRQSSYSQIEKLTLKLKQMQQKLIKVQQKQKQLQEMEKQKINQQQSKGSKQKHSKNSRVSSKTITIERQSVKQEEQNSVNNVVKIQGIKHKDKKIQKILESDSNNDKQSLISEKKVVSKRQELRKIAQERHRPRKLQIQSSTIAYNFAEDLTKQKSIEEESNQKQKMDLEIAELKKIIKQLKIDKIKQEATIQQLQSKTNKKQTNNFIQQNDSSITFQGTQSKSSSIVQENNFKQVRLQQETLAPIEKIAQNERPLAKREPRRSLKMDSNKNKNMKFNHQISGQQKSFTIEVSSANKPAQNERAINPQQSQVSSIKGELKKKGIIIRQLINKQKFNSLQFTSSDNFGDDFSLDQESKVDSEMRSYADKKNSKVQAIYDLDMSQFVRPQITVPQIEVLQGFPIPQLPSTPLVDATQSQILASAKKICEIFEIKVNNREQLQFKKFKNCVILKTNEINKAIVWHFSGKFYVGGWDQNSGSGEDHKHGDGFQFVPNKHYYRGQFSNGKRNGHGTMIMIDGDIYKGQWQNGQRHGKGKYFDKKTNSIYQGQWKQGKKDGFGTYKIKDNEFYQGEHSKNCKQGNGLQLFPNGDIYVGEYKNGKFQGKGKYFWSNGSIYVGDFVDGERQGTGKWISNINEGDIYVGGYKKDKKEGKGRYIWANGCAFDGQFKSDLKHGQGKVEYQDGRQVKGTWQFGKLKKIYRQEEQQQNEQIYSIEQIQPRIRPNIPRIMQTPSRQMQESKLINGI